MEDPSKSDIKSSRFLNPWVLSFQKLGLELKCPLCLNLLNRPVLLPCNHVFCQSCVPGYTDCSVCNAKFIDRDLRHLPFMENMVTIYRCLDATFSTNLIHPSHLDAGRISLQTQALTNIKFDEENNKEFLENGINGRSRRRQSISKRFRVDPNANEDNMDVKLVARSAPDSPPSFGDAKGSENDSYFQCSEHSSENSLVKRAGHENGGSRKGKLGNDSSCLDNDNFRDVKRQKQLNYGLTQLVTSKDDHIKGEEEISHSSISIPNSDLKLQNIPQPSMQAPKTADGLFVNSTVCAFCNSSKISEETGIMLHYLNGKLVVDHEATCSSVIHVHKLCIDWAPQVFYVDDKVKNLKAELARGAKLKCSKCGKKGAALGCYVKSCRRSYHAPCAKGIAKCRWDHADYLVLCPVHSSVKFPNEKSKSEKNISKNHATPAVVSCQISNQMVLPDEEKKWVLCGSALSAKEKSLTVKFGKMNDVVVSKFWNPKVTHVIAATDEKGACTRTLKILMAILNGSWVVTVDWIKACIEAKCHVDEEPFEVGFDNYGCYDGPKNGRLRESRNEPKLFSGLNFYFVVDFEPSYLQDLQDLVIAAGGTLIKSREELSTQSNAESGFVVYNIDLPEGCKLGEEVSALWKRLSEAEDVALQTGCKVIGHTWLLESIAGHKLRSVVC